MCLEHGEPMLDEHGIDIFHLPEHLRLCSKCYGAGCSLCNELGYVEKDLDKQWEPLGITHEEALEDWDAALKENFGDEVLKQVQAIRRKDNA